MDNEMKFSYLTNLGLYTYSDRFITIVKVADPELIGVKVFYDNTEVAFIDFSQALLKNDKNVYTEVLVEKDKKREKKFVALRDYIKICSTSDVLVEKESANILMGIIRKYGWSLQLEGYKNQTALLDSVLYEFSLLENQEHMRIIDCVGRYQKVEDAENSFKETYLARLSNPEKDLPTIAETRKPLIDNLDKLLNIISLLQESAPTAVLQTLNEEIDRLNAQTMTEAKAGHTRRLNGDDDDVAEVPEENNETNQEVDECDCSGL